jgi:hypothetical protein
MKCGVSKRRVLGTELNGDRPKLTQIGRIQVDNSQRQVMTP